MLGSELLKDGAGVAAHSSDGNTESRQESDLVNIPCMHRGRSWEIHRRSGPGATLEHVIPMVTGRQ